MCGRFTLTQAAPDLGKFFSVQILEDFPPRYNIAPTQPILTIWEESGRRVARLARWGFVPGWVKDPRSFSLIVNARGETVTEKPSFRDALRHHRCIVPASGYYEWHTAPDGTKEPWYVTLKSGEPMALAGLYSTWMGPNGEEVDTVTLMTLEANADVAHIHYRMPVVLKPGDIDPWLDVLNVDSPEAIKLVRPLREGLLQSHRVSSRANSNKFDDPSLIAPLSPEEAAAEPEKATASKPRKPASPQLDLF